MEGTENARKVAKQTMVKVKKAMKLDYQKEIKMFTDYAKIYAKAGNGGNGAISFKNYN